VGQAIRTMGPKPGKMDPLITRALHGRDMVVPVRPANDAPVQIRGSNKPAGKPVFPSGTKKTQGLAAGYDERYQVGPGESFTGAGFRSLKPGQYLDEPRGWGA
jgi:hypothetical protein